MADIILLTPWIRRKNMAKRLIKYGTNEAYWTLKGLVETDCHEARRVLEKIKELDYIFYLDFVLHPKVDEDIIKAIVAHITKNSFTLNVSN